MQTRTRQRAGAAPSPAPGPVVKAARRAGRVQLGDEGFLWALVALELFATGFLRHRFRSSHGG